MDVDLKLLRSFVEVARCRSFTRAAGKLNLSQPRLSVRIQEMEQHLGFRLFRRVTRHVELTAEGARLFEHTVRCLQQADKLAALMQDMSHGYHHRLNVGASPLFTTERWEILERFASTHPHARPRITTAPTPELLERLREDTIDLAFAVGVPPLDLESVTLWTSSYGLVMPADSPLTAYDEILPAQLHGATIQTFPREAIPTLHAHLTAILTPFSARMVDLVEGCSEAIVQHVQMTRSIVVSPKWWLTDRTAPPGLAYRPLDGVNELVQFYIVKARSELPRGARQLWETFDRAARGMVSASDVSLSDVGETGRSSTTQAELVIPGFR